MLSLLGDQAENVGCLCKVGDLLVVTSQRIPSFVAGTRLFSRALVFGARSMAFGYRYNNFRFKDRSRKLNLKSWRAESPYLCRVRTGKKKTAYCQANYGSFVLQENPGDGTPNRDLGRVTVDLLEP